MVSEDNYLGLTRPLYLTCNLCNNLYDAVIMMETYTQDSRYTYITVCVSVYHMLSFITLSGHQHLILARSVIISFFEKFEFWIYIWDVGRQLCCTYYFLYSLHYLHYCIYRKLLTECGLGWVIPSHTNDHGTATLQDHNVHRMFSR